MLSNLPLDQPFSTQWNNVFIWTSRPHFREYFMQSIYLAREQNRSNIWHRGLLSQSLKKTVLISIHGDLHCQLENSVLMYLCDIRTWINHHFE